MTGFLEQLLLLLERGERVALTTVIEREGSVPAPADPRLLVCADGSAWGTVGGGLVEAEAVRASHRALEESHPVISRCTFDSREVSAGSMLCGGRIALFTEVILPGRGEEKIFAAALEELAAGRPVLLATLVTESSGRTGRMLFNPEGVLAGSLGDKALEDGVRAAVPGVEDAPDPVFFELDPGRFPDLAGLLVEVFQPSPVLVIFGGGHIAVPLCRLGAMCGFRVTVVDDRPEYASSERFPEAREVLCDDFAAIFDRLNPGPGHYLVAVTRSHQQDQVVISHALKYPAAYLGMIGSRRKVKLLWDDLRKKGVDQSVLDRVHAPVGLAIGAETPAEIAVSIMAQIVQVRRDRKPAIRRAGLKL
jgi:xanthine dehydrogenase accessory factor